MKLFVVGKSLDTWAAIVPRSISAKRYHARIAEVSLREVNKTPSDAVRAMGGNRWRMMSEVLAPEALPGLVAGSTVTL